MYKNYFFVFFVFALLVTGCQPQEAPQGAILAVTSFCSQLSCEVVQIGPTTKQMDYAGRDILDRWCVEVQYKYLDNPLMVMAIIVEKRKPEPGYAGYDGWYIASKRPNLFEDCDSHWLD